MSLAANLGILGFFKYFNFFVDSAAALSGSLGHPWDTPSWRIILPVGISFFTFQSMSYTIDIYRRELQPARSVRDFAMFVSFFPQLVAGPIVRASEFLPQLVRPHRLSAIDFRFCITLFLAGLIKKSCIADHLALLVDPVFATPEAYRASAIWLAVILYAIQIYCDFSGYSDMATACAALLGYRLPSNFDGPYLANNIRNFWQRWHQTLSRWLKDYLYIPLGGSRHTWTQTQRNLLLTMLLGGLWHGAGWNFVIWGGLHGVALITFQFWKRFVDIRLPFLVGWAVTMFWICLTWIFFRSHGFGQTLSLLDGFLTLRNQGPRALPHATVVIVLGLWLMHWLNARLRPLERLDACPDWLFAVLFGAVAAVTLSFAQTDARPFIYFQF
jgi:alginate O-acetyltransferase complex protein AlgI